MKIEEEINWELEGFSLARIAHARDVLIIDGVRHAACGRQKLIVFFYKEIHFFNNYMYSQLSGILCYILFNNMLITNSYKCFKII